MKMTLGEIAELTGAALEGDSNRAITGAAGLHEAGEGDISFLENPKYTSAVAESKAACVILPRSLSASELAGPANRIYSDAPKRDYAKVLGVIEKEKARAEPPGISPKADVNFEARLGKDVYVGPFTVIRGRTLVGERTVIGPLCHIGYNCRIGKDCVIHPNVTILDYTEIHDRVIIHSGTVIGSDGYGYWTDPKTGEHVKVPQVGQVVIEDDVEIGSNVSVDRATTGQTRIGAGTKIDNLVQIGHNVTIGKNGLLVSQVGLAGSTKVGRQVTLAGQVGVAGHLTIGDGATVAAQSGVMGDVEPKSVVFGSPARPHREAMKLQAILSRLPEIYDAVKGLKHLFPKKEEESHAKRKP